MFNLYFLPFQTTLIYIFTPTNINTIPLLLINLTYTLLIKAHFYTFSTNKQNLSNNKIITCNKINIPISHWPTQTSSHNQIKTCLETSHPFTSNHLSIPPPIQTINLSSPKWKDSSAPHSITKPPPLPLLPIIPKPTTPNPLKNPTYKKPSCKKTLSSKAKTKAPKINNGSDQGTKKQPQGQHKA